MADDEFVEGDSHSEAADAPETDPAPRGVTGGFDSGAVADAPVQRQHRVGARSAEARKLFAARVLADKDKPAVVRDDDILDPDEPAPVVAAKPALAATADAAKAKAEAIIAAPVAAAAQPPAPSLDPEVRKLREEMKREREAIQAERAELEKAKAAPAAAAVTPPDLERYLDNAPTAFRQWLEDMRGDKLSDDEFKAEMSDFITMASGDVLGVPLPENVRTKLEATQAKKMVRTNKMLMTKREQEAATRAEKERAAVAEKLEAERVEGEWKSAADAVSRHFAAADSPAAKTYQWLAAEDDPGSVVVDVIRAALNRDGTQLKMEEAAKLADEYLKGEHMKSYTKRQALFQPTATKPAAAVAPAAAAKPVAPATPAPAPKPIENPTRWNNDKHRENTRAAFRAQLAVKE